jgi:hypothetical protein
MHGDGNTAKRQRHVTPQTIPGRLFTVSDDVLIPLHFFDKKFSMLMLYELPAFLGVISLPAAS